jgi:hypothetical protein
VGLKVSSLGALEELATRFEQKIEASPRPGGGQRIVIFDPDGRPVEMVYGAQRVAAVPTREPLNFNSGGKRSRLGRIPIFENRPVPVLDLRHTIMSSQKPQRLIDWLVKELGGYPSDVIVDDDNVAMMAFLRFPKGAEYVEHHHIGVSLGAQPSAQHTCFETIDLDAVFMGHTTFVETGAGSRTPFTRAVSAESNRGAVLRIAELRNSVGEQIWLEYSMGASPSSRGAGKAWVRASHERWRVPVPSS